MDCPVCHTANPKGQKFCGACGRKLESECPGCGASNPPGYKFCGQCGASLALSGAITLAFSGLITGANPKALDLLGYNTAEFEGKPFSLFVERDDMVVFFSHWNEFRSSSKHQSFEIALRHKHGNSVYLLLDFGADAQTGQNPGEVRVLLDEITESRKVSTQMQFQEDLLNLVFSTTDALSTVSRRHIDRSIEDALKKICLVTEADRSFIYSFNRKSKRMDPAYQWRQESSSSEDTPDFRSVPVAMVKRAIVRLRKENGYVVEDVAKLTPAERYELLSWHQADLGAVVCHLLYSAKHPIGVIGIAKHTCSQAWSPNCIALVKFMGQVLADRLPFARQDPSGEPRGRIAPLSRNTKSSTAQNKSKVIDLSEKWSLPQPGAEGSPLRSTEQSPHANSKALPDMARPMLLEELSGRNPEDQQPVFPRDDGVVRLTCPKCGFQESVSLEQFEKLGNAMRVTCICRKIFSAVLEKRRAFRKTVRLQGHFSLKGDLRPADSESSIWGLMVVRDLSKAGLRFSTTKADLIHPGDLLMVRFHLDNSNQALIHKPARVISVTGDAVGCRFEGDDSYDITLGFYFI